MSSPSNNKNRVLPGRVVRLHFACRAELPLGSFLRVTGSTLWAPGTSAADPAEAAPAVGRTEQSAFPVTEPSSETTAGDSLLLAASTQQLTALYTSSVEMVTTPETYPIWRTRKPVVVVLNRHAATKKSVQHHYYRYLVVSPGAAQNREEGHPDDTGMIGSTVVSTSSEFSGSTVVMQWEDPFQFLQREPQIRATSAVSLASSIGVPSTTHTRADYRNLPYRTLDIDVATAKVCNAQDQTQDQWNVADDASFQPFLIRQAVRSVE